MSTHNRKSLVSGPSATLPSKDTARTRIVDVAREAGVSITTVSHAMNGRGQVDPSTRERVRHVAERLGYRPNRHAQRLRGGSSDIIALVSSMPFSVAGGASRLGFMMEIAAVAAGVALERGLALMLVPSSGGGGAALESLDLDGAIVIEPAEGDAQVAQLVERGIAVVTIGSQPGGAHRLSGVDLRSGDTTLQLLEHMRTQGRRRIALVTGQQRRSPYLEAVAAYGVFAKRHRMEQVVVTVDENLGEASGRGALGELLAKLPAVDAICAPVDAVAAGLVPALRAIGRSVPGDVMIATRYDGPRARECDPPLTALNLHLDQVATQAIDLLMAQLRDRSAHAILRAPNAELIVRASTTAAPD